MTTTQGATQAAEPRIGREEPELAGVKSAIARSRDYLLSQQDPEGFWSGELEAKQYEN